MRLFQAANFVHRESLTGSFAATAIEKTSPGQMFMNNKFTNKTKRPKQTKKHILRSPNHVTGNLRCVSHIIWTARLGTMNTFFVLSNETRITQANEPTHFGWETHKHRKRFIVFQICAPNNLSHHYPVVLNILCGSDWRKPKQWLSHTF